jgi:hypothetical protein
VSRSATPRSGNLVVANGKPLPHPRLHPGDANYGVAVARWHGGCSVQTAAHQRRDPLVLVPSRIFPLFSARTIRSSTSLRLRQPVDQPSLLSAVGDFRSAASGISFMWLPSSRPPTPIITSHCIVSSALFPPCISGTEYSVSTYSPAKSCIISPHLCVRTPISPLIEPYQRSQYC